MYPPRSLRSRYASFGIASRNPLARRRHRVRPREKIVAQDLIGSTITSPIAPPSLRRPPIAPSLRRPPIAPPAALSRRPPRGALPSPSRRCAPATLPAVRPSSARRRPSLCTIARRFRCTRGRRAHTATSRSLRGCLRTPLPPHLTSPGPPAVARHSRAQAPALRTHPTTPLGASLLVQESYGHGHAPLVRRHFFSFGSTSSRPSAPCPPSLPRCTPGPRTSRPPTHPIILSHNHRLNNASVYPSMG